MSDPTLEAIDNALRDWEVSDDAMRWTPEPAPESEPPDPGEFAQAVLAAYRRQLIAFAEAVRPSFEAVRESAKNAFKAYARYQVLFDGLRQAETDARRSAMHSAYRHRQLARRRRK